MRGAITEILTICVLFCFVSGHPLSSSTNSALSKADNVTASTSANDLDFNNIILARLRVLSHVHEDLYVLGISGHRSGETFDTATSYNYIGLTVYDPNHRILITTHNTLQDLSHWFTPEIIPQAAPPPAIWLWQDVRLTLADVLEILRIAQKGGPFSLVTMLTIENDHWYPPGQPYYAFDAVDATRAPIFVGASNGQIYDLQDAVQMKAMMTSNVTVPGFPTS